MHPNINEEIIWLGMMINSEIRADIGEIEKEEEQEDELHLGDES